MLATENQQKLDAATAGFDVRLDLTVTDRDTVVELLKQNDRSARDEYALSALKVGVLAIRQACGVVDAQSIQQECQK